MSHKTGSPTKTKPLFTRDLDQRTVYTFFFHKPIPQWICGSRAAKITTTTELKSPATDTSPEHLLENELAIYRLNEAARLGV